MATMETAAKTLVHYIKLALERSGVELNSDCLGELEGAIQDFASADRQMSDARRFRDCPP
jgi:hypothetical protein